VSSSRSLAPAALAVALILVSFFLRVLWLDHPSKQFIFDEKYYVSAASTMLGLPQPADAPYAHSPVGKDPNEEHPPLAKLIIAADMAAVGNNAWGWRWGSVLAGTLAIAFLFRLARGIGLGGWAALLAAFLFAFDNLVFVTSRIGILDIFMLVGMLAGAAWFVAGRPATAGLAFAFSTLCKEYGGYGPAIMVCYAVALTVMQRPDRKQVLRRAGEVVVMAVVYLASFVLVLWLLDRRWSTFTNPIAHLRHIWTYGTGLRNPAGPTGIASWPWQWLLNGGQIPYYKVTNTICKVALAPGVTCPTDDIIRQYASVFFRGALNPYLILTAPITIAYALTLVVKQRDRAALLALVWFAVSYLPFIPAAAIDHRISYIYYMLPVVPSLALAGAQLFTSPRLPRAVTVGYILAILYGFGAYFPFVGFSR
jgi:dolichyl-phosphate-mannose-protein mannosyltransferase